MAGAASSQRAKEPQAAAANQDESWSVTPLEENADPADTGAQPSEDSDASLPFTGFEIALLAALGLLAMTGGRALRRAAGA